MKKYTLCTVLSCVLTIPAYNALALTGLDCTTQPSCEDLGYSTSTSCNNGSLIYCPFNVLYKKCIPNAPSSDSTETMNCAAEGFTQEDKSSWCNVIVKCSADESYTLCACHGAIIDNTCETAYKSCEAAGYVTEDEDKYCVEPSESVSIYLLDGTQTDCYEKCYDIHDSCEKAGLVEKGTNQICIGEQNVYTSTSGNTITCYTSCKTAYESCDKAGYVTKQADQYCTGKKSIYLLDGTQTECYEECHDVYDSCSEANLVEKTANLFCSGEQNIYTNAAGAYTKCYESCHVDTCEDYGYLAENPSRSCEVCTSIAVTTTAGDTLWCYKNDCKVDDSCCQTMAQDRSTDECRASTSCNCVCDGFYLDHEVCSNYTYQECRCDSGN